MPASGPGFPNSTLAGEGHDGRAWTATPRAPRRGGPAAGLIRDVGQPALCDELIGGGERVTTLAIPWDHHRRVVTPGGWSACSISKF
jgi:hypothetical protein